VEEGEMTDREELRIKQLEEESRHEHAMRLLQAERLDAHDASLEGIRATLDVVGVRLDEASKLMAQLAVSQTKTDAMLKDLIRAITAEHPNGKGKQHEDDKPKA
jgi:hypothetical protein